MKQDKNQNSIPIVTVAAARERKRLAVKTLSPSAKAAVPVGPRKRPIAVIGRDHRTPNETSLPLWPICSPTLAFPFLPGWMWSHGSRATSQWVITPTSVSRRQFFLHGRTDKPPHMNNLSSSVFSLSLVPQVVHPLSHFADEVGGGLRVSPGGVYLTTDRSCSGIFSSTCGPRQP